MFYIAFIVFYIWSVISTKNPLYGGNPVKILLSVVGLDGYFQYRMVNYYQVGEWFLGAIIMLYAIYPLLLKIFNKSVWLMTLICLVLYGFVYIPDFWIIPKSMNFFGCLISFEFGMLLMKYKNLWYNKLVWFIVSLMVSGFIIFVPISLIPKDVFARILSISLFVILSYLGEHLMRLKISKAIFCEIASISFAVFLVHHKVIYKATQIFIPPNNFISMCFLAVVIIITFLLAKLLFVTNNQLLTSKVYKKLERRVLF